MVTEVHNVYKNLMVLLPIDFIENICSRSIIAIGEFDSQEYDLFRLSPENYVENWRFISDLKSNYNKLSEFL